MGRNTAFVFLVVGCGMAALATGGCATSQPHAVAAATPEQTAAMFGQVKSLEGTWEMSDEKGNAMVAAVFAVSSNGSVVREVMFPGAPHEMTNVYHMDGQTLLVTHYCAEGNQPVMRARTATPGRIAFAFDSITNFTDPSESYMGELTLVIVDKDHVRQEWVSFKEGKRQPPVVFELKRRA